MAPSDEQLQDALHEVGLANFRPLQREAICAVCSGRDCLVVVATGVQLVPD
jgi:superfamily II DNA helicase RecQ